MAHAVLFEIDLANRGLTAVQHARLDLCFPAGHRLAICDERGERLDEGALVPATTAEPELDRWVVDDVRIGDRSDRLFHFCVRVHEPGAYPLKMQIASPDLRQKLIVDAALQVGREEGERSPEETISALIDQGEAIAGQTADVVSGSELHREAGAFVLSTLVGVLELERPDLRRRLDNAVIEHAGPKTGGDYLRALIRSKVRALYDIRRELN